MIPVLMTLLLFSSRAIAAEKTVDFERDIAPILKNRCLGCHQDRVRQGGLALHSAVEVRKGGESGEIIDPGDPDSSYLIDLITAYDGVAEMPQEAAPLTTDEVQAFRSWIKQGAHWPENLVLQPPVLWSLRTLTQPPVPTVTQTSADFPIRNPIDAFVAARHQLAGVQPAPPASKRTLIRRLYLDLTGLLPTPEEVAEFIADEDPRAYEKLVDILLASPHFGERWGRFWLDLARYADSDGYLGDSMRPHAWVYQEWVIQAINDDLPFDQFSIEQLAGDLLEKPTDAQLIATGFHRNTLSNTEAGVDLELYRTKELVDRVNTTGMVWLGFTLGCAECHDHKHDPISQKEFYQFYSFFNNADDSSVKVSHDWDMAEYQSKQKQWEPAYEKALTSLQKFEKSDLTADQKAEITKTLEKYKRSSDLKKISTFYETKQPGWDKLYSQLESLLKTRPSPPATRAPTFKERTKDRRDTFVHVRGIYNQHGEKVDPGTPAVLPEFNAGEPLRDRLDLARWLFQENNPLTARVAVNRIWQHLFARGLVATPNDFGTKGEPPTHPLLLDWLAAEYKSQNWSRKSMIRLIVMSSTYRMSSAANASPVQHDVNNQLLWRQNSYRVEAEIVRDIHLTASSLLDRTIGRRGIRPPLPAFVTDVGRSVKWPATEGSARYRRGMYIVFKRTVPYPMLMTFDAPDATVSCSRRERSNTPLQALTLLNGPLFFESAQALGKLMWEEYQDDLPAATEEMFLRCFSRSPAPREQEYLNAAYADLLYLAENNQAKTKSAEDPQLTALIQLARIVMNLDEFITRD
ncbi:PSD1 and planctomycete cytochrome C domain-containing protein [Gimesia sp.]|uniref:PSD1 and planctomycete cytochrome C domain-containing protein n=1 Tax=Gimesia sp. TaxID=2024833 RepID=UPI003A92EC07